MVAKAEEMLTGMNRGMMTAQNGNIAFDLRSRRLSSIWTFRSPTPRSFTGARTMTGMSCIAVPTEQTRHHDFSKATRICSSLDEITLELIDSLSH